MKPLTKSEKFQFSLTGSHAKSITAQRAVIQREGLQGLKPKDVRAARQAAFREWCEKQPDLKGLPIWLAKTRWYYSGDDWRHEPVGKIGKVVDVHSLSQMAYEAVDWGSLRKHSKGQPPPFTPAVSVRGGGYRQRVYRNAQYLCVLSPDKRQIAIQVDKQQKIEIHPILRRQFLFGGKRHRLPGLPPAVKGIAFLKAQQYARILLRFLPPGLDCGTEKVSIGQAIEVVIREQATGELYHISRWSDQPLEMIQWAIEAFAKRSIQRRLTTRNAELDQLIQQHPDRVWVSFQDSIVSGNCEAHSLRFREELQTALRADGQLGAVRADVILARRDDDFTRRACRVAALRALRS